MAKKKNQNTDQNTDRTAKNAVDEIKDKAGDVKADVQDAAEQVKEDVHDAVRETKADVQEFSEAVKDDVKDAVRETKVDVQDAAGAVKAAARQVKQNVQQAAEQTKADAQEAVGAVKAAAQQTKQDVQETFDQLEAEADQLEEEMNQKALKLKARQKMFSNEMREKAGKIKTGATQKTIQFRESAKGMSDDLKKLLAKEISDMRQREKRRSAEMISIFAKHNFYAGGFTPVELRTTLEDLGPTYVKIGQIMSSRVDMLPESYCKELEKLRQNVEPLESSVVRAVIEQETGKKIEEIYKDFDDEPLGSASIGQVHRATLLDGTQVVTKVQRPLIADMMRKDFVLLKKLASVVKTINEGNDDQGEQIDLLAVLEELEKVENEELDFRVEARNTIYFKENCIGDDTKVTCPSIYEDLTTERMMTSTFVDGYSVSKKDRIEADGFDVNVIGEAILDNYVHQVLDVGTFHADPHQGNIMINRDGIPTWIDFGMIGHLTEANIKMIQDLILAIINLDTEELANAALAMGAGGPKTSREKLSQDLDGLISKYMSVTNLDELDTAALLGEVMDIMSDNYIKIPGEYTMLVRSIATIEGVMEELCPELNLFKIITDKLLERAKKSFDLQQTMLSVGKDALAVGKKASRIPSLASDALNSVIKGRTKIKFELTGYEGLMNQLTEIIKLSILALFSCVLFFGSCILCMTDMQPTTVDGLPVMAVVGFIFSIALAIYTVKKISQQQKKK